MLPLDSNRWSTLLSCMGTSEGIAASIARFSEYLDQADRSTLSLEFEELDGEIDYLDHQQTTYPGTTAALPHLVAIAQRLPLEFKVRLLNRVAEMHHDGAHMRTDEEDLRVWYEEGCSEGQRMTRELLGGSEPLSFGDQIGLLESLYQFEGDNHYPFREHDWFGYSCPKCKTDLHASYEDSEFRVWRAKDGDEAPFHSKTFVTPTPDLQQAVLRPEHAALQLAVDLARQGMRRETQHWLRALTGTSPCPDCGETIPLIHSGH